MTTYSTEQIDKAIEDAGLAFWASVAKSFPEITTGDFPPGDSMQFAFACTETVRAWLDVEMQFASTRTEVVRAWVDYNSPTDDR
jgi:hypothetical protein